MSSLCLPKVPFIMWLFKSGNWLRYTLSTLVFAREDQVPKGVKLSKDLRWMRDLVTRLKPDRCLLWANDATSDNFTGLDCGKRVRVYEIESV